jgi:hypothetical protein
MPSYEQKLTDKNSEFILTRRDDPSGEILKVVYYSNGKDMVVVRPGSKVKLKGSYGTVSGKVESIPTVKEGKSVFVSLDTGLLKLVNIDELYYVEPII